MSLPFFLYSVEPPFLFSIIAQAFSLYKSPSYANLSLYKKTGRLHKSGPATDGKIWWGRADSNRWPLRCQRSALTNWATPPAVLFILPQGCTAVKRRNFLDSVMLNPFW